ncbi:MAG: trypsin-like peptidase domain-containing protein [Chloroflexota bacterium]
METSQTQWQQRGQTLFAYAHKQFRRGLPFLVGILATLAGLIVYNQLFPPPQRLTQQDIDNRILDSFAAATPPPAYSTTVYETILPSFVLIEVGEDEGPGDGNLARTSTFQNVAYRSQGEEGPEGEPDGEDPQFGIGSGVIINAEGAILTALHLVEWAEVIRVTFADGTEAQGQLVAAEPDNDIAVLAVDTLPQTYAPATLGNPNAMRIGDEAYVVGNPLGFAASLSAGVISGFNRTFTPPVLDYELTRLIQFDAAVNPGTLGGPLLNRNGEVIGVVVGLANPMQLPDFSGVGLAVRIDVATVAAGGPPQ